MGFYVVFSVEKITEEHTSIWKIHILVFETSWIENVWWHPEHVIRQGLSYPNVFTCPTFSKCYISKTNYGTYTCVSVFRIQKSLPKYTCPACSFTCPGQEAIGYVKLCWPSYTYQIHVCLPYMCTFVFCFDNRVCVTNTKRLLTKSFYQKARLWLADVSQSQLSFLIKGFSISQSQPSFLIKAFL